jgi:hypothetical protein
MGVTRRGGFAMCFSWSWLENFLIWLVIICAVIALLRLLINFVVPKIGVGADVIAVIVQAITIVIWAIVCIAIIAFVFNLIACVLSGGGFPRLR